MTDLYWIGIIKKYLAEKQRYEYAAMLRDFERDLYAKYSNNKPLANGAPIPLCDIHLGRESFLFDILENIAIVMESKYHVNGPEFRNLIKGLIPLAREEKLNLIFSK